MRRSTDSKKSFMGGASAAAMGCTSVAQHKRADKFRLKHRKVVEFANADKKTNALKRTHSLPARLGVPDMDDSGRTHHGHSLHWVARNSSLHSHAASNASSKQQHAASSKSTLAASSKHSSGSNSHHQHHHQHHHASHAHRGRDAMDVAPPFSRSWSSSPHRNRYVDRRQLPVMAGDTATLHLSKRVLASLSSMIAKSSYVPFSRVTIHEHTHRRTPHLHRADCERYTSAFDKNRQARFYFQPQATPVRVYLSYNEKLIDASAYEFKDNAGGGGGALLASQLNPLLNGRKLSARTLRTQLKISPNYVEEAKNLFFVKDSLSLIPQLNLNAAGNPITQHNYHNSQPFGGGGASLQHPLSMAEMAVIPLAGAGASTVGSNASQIAAAKLKTTAAVKLEGKAVAVVTMAGTKLISTSTASLANSDTSK